MAGRKRYNIWIAYSDLFTNLSTFLFVSALGMFAAIGSGVLSSPGWGGATGCGVPPEVAPAIQANGSMLAPLPAQDPCARYFRIGTFKFRYSAAGIGEFKDDAGRSLTPQQRLKAICAPIWLTITRQDFRDANGQLTFLGIASGDNGWKHQPECKRLSRGQPRIDHPDFPRGKSAAFVISECDRLPTAYPAICPLILECKGRPENDRNDLCQEVEAARKWDAHVPAACLRNVAQQQAREIYKMCELAPIDVSFPNHKFLGDGMDKNASRIDARPIFWESSVDYAAPRDGTISLGASTDKNPGPAPSGGAVVVELRFGR